MPPLADPEFRRGPNGPTYARGAKVPWWSVLALPFLALFPPLWHAARRRVRWLAAVGTVLLFEVVMLPLEHEAIIRGHWVYNEQRIWGWTIWGVPAEEPLIYYLFPPLLVILLFEALGGWFSRHIRLASSTRAALAGLHRHVRHRPVRSLAYGVGGVAALLTAFFGAPVGNWLDRTIAAWTPPSVVLRWRLTDDGELRCYNAGKTAATGVTVEVTFDGVVDPATVAVHVPRRVEATVVRSGAGADPDVAVTLTRLYPRESDRDDEIVSLRAAGRIRSVQFVSAEGRARPDAGSRTPAEVTGRLPVADLP